MYFTLLTPVHVFACVKQINVAGREEKAEEIGEEV